MAELLKVDDIGGAIASDDDYGARLTVDLDALAENWRSCRAMSGNARCAAVVKADAYGLGAVHAGNALYEAGCRDFFVATAREGAELRPHAPDARIYVMNCMLPGMEMICRAAELVPVLASMEQVAWWSAHCIEMDEHPCALQVDTGMNRLGVTVEEALDLANDVSRPAGFAPVLVMSHLASSDDPNHPQNTAQLERFRRVADAFDGVEASLAASAGILLGPDYHFDLTRPGIALYGGRAANQGNTPLRVVATAEARIMTIRQARAGETVSYGATVELSRDSRIAVCSVGYADGYLRSVSGSGVPLRDVIANGASGWIKGQAAPVLGRVTMDITAFDVTDLPAGSVAAGDFIELFGPNIPVDDVADAAGTIGYEVLTSLGKRYHRQYIRPQSEPSGDG